MSMLRFSSTIFTITTLSAHSADEKLVIFFGFLLSLLLLFIYFLFYFYFFFFFFFFIYFFYLFFFFFFFFFFFLKIDFDLSCVMGTICMICQNLSNIVG